MANFKPFGSGAFGEDAHVPFYSRTTLDKIKGVGGLTFYKDYSEETLDATYSVGSGTATFTSARDATHPATYVDSAGVVQTTTTANVGRFDYGYYDATGYHAFDAPKLHIEDASTNLITKSNNVEDAIFTKTNVTAANADAGSSSPDGTATAPSLTASANDGTFLLAAGVTAQTYSVWIKRKTGTGSISITANSGGAYAEVTVTSNWSRFDISVGSASQTCGIKIAIDTDAIYIWGNQFEALAYATSFIPTTAAALTRNAETLNYVISGNRTAATEGLAITVIPQFAATIQAEQPIMGTDTKDRKLYFNASNNDVVFKPNGSDDANCAIYDMVNANWAAYDSLVLGYSCQSGTSPYAAGYLAGSTTGTNETSDTYTNNVWGTDFSIGSSSSGFTVSNFYVANIAIYSKAVSADEYATIVGLL